LTSNDSQIFVSSSESSGTGVIIGVLFALLVLVGVGLVLIFFYVRHKRKQQTNTIGQVEVTKNIETHDNTNYVSVQAVVPPTNPNQQYTTVPIHTTTSTSNDYANTTMKSADYANANNQYTTHSIMKIQPTMYANNSPTRSNTYDNIANVQPMYANSPKSQQNQYTNAPRSRTIDYANSPKSQPTMYANSPGKEPDQPFSRATEKS
jgi:hypothetical protein